MTCWFVRQCSLDALVMAWTIDGQKIGLFGQKDGWDLLDGET
jgi:hypothetical protein